MSQPFFQFKQFTVWHDKCAMKVGTDGVLLGAWTLVESSARILDIGTGTGLVALMLAQRCSASVIALEIDGKAAQQAAENITRSPWGSRIEVVCQDFRLYSNKNNSLKYDTIVSNPPYFTDSLKCPDSQRNTARHNDNLSYEELLKGVSNLLSPNGTFTVVIPMDASDSFKDIASSQGLYPSRQLLVITKPGAPPKRTLISFTFIKQDCKEEKLLTEVSRHRYSDEYIKLTREFYLKM